MYTCANCTVLACANNEPEKMPKNCPMRNASVMEAARAGYDLPENHDFYVNCSAIEGLGYCQWPRLKETVEFCKRMGYHKLGLAFCKGLRKEARIVADLLRAQGFEVCRSSARPVASPKKKWASRKRSRSTPANLRPCATPSHRQSF